MDKNKKNKLIMLTISTLAILIIVVGVSYAFFRFSLSSANQELVAGQIYMHYKEGQKQINISEAVPSSTYDENEYFEFTIDGKNTSNKDIWYAITLSYGDAPSDRDTKIEDKFLKFTLFEGASKVVDGACYKELNNKKLWVNKIDKNTIGDVNITYKLYMWISDKVNIGDDGDYTIDTWNNKVYASVKVNVVGDFTEKTIDKPDGSGPIMEGTLTGLAKDIFDKAYTNEQELIAIDKEGNKCESLSGCEVRELRYIGPSVNNYIYLKDNNGYNEKWRIIGLFLNDAGTEWNIKIVRDEILPGDYLPLTYVINDAEINGVKKKVTYKLRYSSSSTNAYWNNDSESELNRWEESGLQYFLNTEHDDSGSNRGYLSYLSSATKALLVDSKTYYLGTVHANSIPYDTPKQAYARERDVESCVDGKGPSTNRGSSSAIESESSGCHVWSGNASTWTGEVALMYLSDYGLSATEANWSKPMYGDSADGFEDAKINETTWMFNRNSTMDAKSKNSWFLSPSSFSYSFVASWHTDGRMINASVSANLNGVRPVLYLSSAATKLDGYGTSESPYRILEEPKAEGLAKTILDKAYSNTSELIAIDKDGNKCKDLASCEGNIREYRYIGPTVNNYVYLKSDTNANEKWRIIGLFLNDVGTEWNVKIVRDEVLPDTYLPAKYVINDAKINGVEKKVTYTLKNSDYYVYWNKNDSGTQLNRWEEAGLQYFLNTDHDDSSSSERGYLSRLSPATRELLVEKTYTLGTVQTRSIPYDTPKQAYEHERWSGNATTWTGEVALMYPSDYGLSASESNWTTPMYYGSSGTGFEDADVNKTTWMYYSMSDSKIKDSWFLSPSSDDSGVAVAWGANGSVNNNYVSSSVSGVRPTLYLSSQATVKSGSGTGTSDSPYVILN